MIVAHCQANLASASFRRPVIATQCARRLKRFGTALPAAARTKASRRTALQPVRAYLREWPDPEFIEEVKEAFPDKGVATVEEARALFSSLGYAYLDVRPTLELEEIGKVKGSINIPIKLATRRWDSEQGKKVVQKEDNPDFVAQVEKIFPDKDSGILIACSNGKAYSMDALEALDEAGYTNLAGLRGGYYAWFKVFDNKLGRRRGDGYTEDYSADGDSTGIHGSGAGFDRMDKADAWVPPEF